MHSLQHEHASRAGSLSLRGGCACLDFANTTSGRDGPLQLEHLQRPEHLADWAEHTGLLASSQAHRLRRRMQSNTAAGRLLLRQALHLREAIHSVGRARATHQSAPGQSLAVLASQYADALRHAKLVERDGSIGWNWSVQAVEGRALIGLVAQSAITLFAGEAQECIKQCAGEHCGWLFLDTSRNKSRRWCDMEVCGNRAKLRRFRQRGEARES